MSDTNGSRYLSLGNQGKKSQQPSSTDEMSKKRKPAKTGEGNRCLEKGKHHEKKKCGQAIFKNKRLLKIWLIY